ncbi:hypothetical protein [Vibrio sp. SCSIO 43136]|uniref:hypothetical protein n=1 Tax=Vibrio sp. SCSIO 43136 TaxID=2819101 RepID=UPI002074FC20|nr:hypothetical protein [Vibrio sp. SCSIO 43136]USD67125.1 hypothetical protein J4N39_21045 [Vibrio sp. SCSIO 43136]
MKKRISLILVATALHGGCTRVVQDDVSLFATSTATLTQNVDELILEHEMATTERNLVMLAAEVNGSTPTLLTSESLSQLPAKTNLYPLRQASVLLNKYSEALLALSLSEQPQESKLATLQLAQAINQFDAYSTSDDSSSGLFSALAVELSQSITAEMQQQAVKSLVFAAEAPLNTLCDEIVLAIEHSDLSRSLIASRQYVLSEQIRDFNQRAQIRSMPLTKSHKEVERLYELWQRTASTELAVQHAIKSIRAVQKNHQVLVAQLKQNKFSSQAISNAVLEMQQLAKGFEDTQTLLQSCDGTIENKNNQFVCSR